MRTRLLAVVTGLGIAAGAMASDLIVFPNAGQDKEQQEQDEFACYGWAKGETGLDPMAVPTATEPPPQQSATQKRTFG